MSDGRPRLMLRQDRRDCPRCSGLPTGRTAGERLFPVVEINQVEAPRYQGCATGRIHAVPGIVRKDGEPVRQRIRADCGCPGLGAGGRDAARCRTYRPQNCGFSGPVPPTVPVRPITRRRDRAHHAGPSGTNQSGSERRRSSITPRMRSRCRRTILSARSGSRDVMASRMA